ncbi:MAG: hypothetical protein ABIK68_14640, partial [bacterium]
MDTARTDQTKSVFDQVFGRTFETIDPGEGIEPVKIDSTSIIHIPGVIKHWQQEIVNRKIEILEYENRSFLERIADLIVDDEAFDDASGDELYDMSPSESAEKLMEEIEDDPTDMNKRLALVSLISRNDVDLSVEMLRDLFLQATVACCFEALSNVGLMVVLKAQEAYLRKLFTLCRIDHTKLQKILEEKTTGNRVTKQRETIEAYSRKVSRNMALLQFFLKYTGQGIQSLQTASLVQLNLVEIKDLIGYVEPQPSKKRRIFANANTLVSTLRYLVLLHDEADSYITQLSKADPEHPLPAILEGRLHQTRLIFLFQQYLAGDPSAQIYPRFRDRFELANKRYLA